MEHHPPHIVVSRCLGFAACRYDGQMLHDAWIERMKPYVTMTTVCPEADIGMGTPRLPVRLVNMDQLNDGQAIIMIQPATGKQFTQSMDAYGEQQAQSLPEMDGFILKSRSPSCGYGDVKIYHSTADDAQYDQGSGLFAAAMRERFPLLAMEHEARLNNFDAREVFLMRIFAFARLRVLRDAPSAAGLSTFHARHKLLLMCFNQNMMRQCGRIASHSDGLPLAEMVAMYADQFHRTLMQESTTKNIINAVYHGFGWLSEGLPSAEKALFIEAVEAYRYDHATLATLLQLLKSYVLRFDHDYLGSQYLLEPYPPALFDFAAESLAEH
jgi:uncharacterized protein YbbK (DUF523 family)/uncharacterized protein YbgA (DUF1722 family)